MVVPWNSLSSTPPPNSKSSHSAPTTPFLRLLPSENHYLLLGTPVRPGAEEGELVCLPQWQPWAQAGHGRALRWGTKVLPPRPCTHIYSPAAALIQPTSRLHTTVSLSHPPSCEWVSASRQHGMIRPKYEIFSPKKYPYYSGTTVTATISVPCYPRSVSLGYADVSFHRLRVSFCISD